MKPKGIKDKTMLLLMMMVVMMTMRTSCRRKEAWHTCENCEALSTVAEAVCCHDLDEVKYDKLKGK